MNRPVTAVFAALESLLVVGIGVGVPVVTLTFLWAFQYGLQIDWAVFWRAGADIWLVGHGVDLSLTLPAATAAATGLSGANAPMLVSIAALGFALLTLLLGARVGRRLAETRHRAIGSGTAIGVFALLALLVTATARHPLAEPSLWQGVVWPTLIYGVPLIVSAEINRRRRGEPADPVTAVVASFIERVPTFGRTVALASLRSGVAAAAAVLALSGVVVALLLLFHYASIITLYEGTHAGLLGGLALTIGQIALVPNAIAWAMSWFVGPGFAIGTGSAVSPLGTTIGPMPAIPLLGALPTSSLAFGFVGLLVPIGAGFVVATLLRPAIERSVTEGSAPDRGAADRGAADRGAAERGTVDRTVTGAGRGSSVSFVARHRSLLARIVIGAATGVVAGLVLGFVALVAGGSAGPGRLAEIGSHPLAVGGFAALEIGLPAVLALVVTQPEWATRERLIGDLADLRPSDLRPAGLRPSDLRPSSDRSARRPATAVDEQVTDVIEPVPKVDPAPEKMAVPKVSTPAGNAGADDAPTDRIDGLER